MYKTESVAVEFPTIHIFIRKCKISYGAFSGIVRACMRYVHCSGLGDMNENVNEKSLGQYHVDFFEGVMPSFLAVLSVIFIC